MIGYSFTHSETVGESDRKIPPQLDITGPEGEVQVEVDHTRGVMYVHLEGATILRICRVGKFNVIQKRG
jgi:hypothetical protein